MAGRWAAPTGEVLLALTVEGLGLVRIVPTVSTSQFCCLVWDFDFDRFVSLSVRDVDLKKALMSCVNLRCGACDSGPLAQKVTAPVPWCLISLV